jgi:NAD(P)-dependent dehydrogenase (short-subunit alcohol dehydrogenase family)
MHVLIYVYIRTTDRWRGRNTGGSSTHIYNTNTYTHIYIYTHTHTGSSTGIGRHAAESLAKAGYLVFAGIRKEGDVDDLVTAIQTHTHTHPHTHTSKGKVVPLLLDVCKSEMIEAAAREVERVLEEEGKKLGALVNNAGIGEFISMCVYIYIYIYRSLARIMSTNTHIHTFL